MATKFKLGDRVIGKPDANDPAIQNLHGVVAELGNFSPTIQFDNWTGGWGEESNMWLAESDDLIFETLVLQQNPPAILPADAAERKKVPIGTGVMDYFPAALAEVAKISYAGNQQHNPGEPLHWARGKSTDQADTMLRHFLERGTLDSDGMRHSAKMCWRALAILQLELESEGYPVARGAK